MNTLFKKNVNSSSSTFLSRGSRHISTSGLPRPKDRSRNDRKSGYTLPELIVYVAILGAILAVIVNMLITMSSVYRHIRVDRALEVSAASVMDRVAHETRLADSVDATSVLGSSPGKLVLTNTDDSGTAHTVTFNIATSTVYVKTDSGTGVPLTTPSVNPTNLTFQKFTSSMSTGVRIQLTLLSTDSRFPKTETFYTTVILRNSYQ